MIRIFTIVLLTAFLSACAAAVPAECDSAAYETAAEPIVVATDAILARAREMSPSDLRAARDELVELSTRAESLPSECQSHVSLVRSLTYAKSAIDRLLVDRGAEANLDLTTARRYLNEVVGISPTPIPTLERTVRPTSTPSCDVDTYRTRAEAIMRRLRQELDPVDLADNASVRDVLSDVTDLRQSAEAMQVDECLALKHETLVFTMRHTEEALRHALAGDYGEMDISLNRALLNQDRFNDWSVDIDR